MQNINISIFDIIEVKTINGLKNLTNQEQGLVLYNKLKEELNNIQINNLNCIIDISFSKLDIVTSHFLYSSIGHLFMKQDFPIDFLKKHLNVVDIDDKTKVLLNRVIKNAINQTNV